MLMFWVQLNRGVFQIWWSFFPPIAIQINGSQSSTFMSMQIYMSVTSYAPFWFHNGKTAWTLVASNRIIPVEIERSTKSLLIDNVDWIERSLLLFEMIRVILKSNELRGYHTGNRILRCLLWFCLWMNV